MIRCTEILCHGCSGCLRVCVHECSLPGVVNVLHRNLIIWQKKAGYDQLGHDPYSGKAREFLSGVTSLPHLLSVVGGKSLSSQAEVGCNRSIAHRKRCACPGDLLLCSRQRVCHTLRSLHKLTLLCQGLTRAFPCRYATEPGSGCIGDVLYCRHD